MKKKLSLLCLAVLAALLLSSLWLLPASAADTATVTLPRNTVDYRYSVDTQGKTDVLDGLCGEYLAPRYATGIADDPILRKVTDGVYGIDPAFFALAGDESAKAYFNMAWCLTNEQKKLEEAGGTIAYKMTDGSEQKYFYRLEWKNLQADVDSFSLWFNNETAYANYKNDSSYSWWQQDAEFAILVSQDGGKTYSVAFASAPLTLTSGGSLKSCASKLKSEGGNWEMVDVTDPSGAHILRYRVCKADFVREFKGVTNIVYASVHPRRNGNSADPFYYAARISEFDVYAAGTGAPAETTAAQTPTTQAPETAAPIPGEDDPAVPALSVSFLNAEKLLEGTHMKFKITNDSDYDVFGVTVQPGDMFERNIVGMENGGFPIGTIPAHGSKEIILMNLAADEKNVSPFLWIGIGGAALLLGVGVFFLVKKNKKGAGPALLLLLCGSLLLTPQLAFAETDGAEGTGTESAIPTVQITRVHPILGNERYQYLSFVASYAAPKNHTVSFQEDCLAEGKKYPASITVTYSEFGVVGGGILAVPTYGLDTLPMAARENRLDLRRETVRGAEIETCAVSEENATQGTFSGMYPDKFYTDTYRTKLTAVAYIEYLYRGKTYTAYSASVNSSVLLSAQELVKEETLPDSEKELLQTIIDKAGKAAVMSEEEETALRRGVVDKMEYMGSVAWKPAATVSTDGQLNYSTPKYEAGKTYYGLIYNQQHYGTVEHFSCLLDKDGTLDPYYTKDVSTVWNLAPGVSCSTSLTAAITCFCPGLTQIVGATSMIPSKTGTGFSKVGDYSVPAAATLTQEIISASGQEVMFRAYARLKPADILDAVWKNGAGDVLGHTIMVREAPEVVTLADGKIDGEHSKIKTIEQHATVIEENGKLTTWKHGEYTFRQLLYGQQMKFVPIQYTNLVAEAALPSYCILSNLNAETMLTEGLSGIVESNFPLRYFGVEVTDAAGNTAYERKITPDTGYAKAIVLGTLSDINGELKALPAGTYTVRLTAMAKNAERLLFEGSVTK